ncbi:Myb-like DNA-binding domain containing protein [Plasmodiophora brassicae]|nr:hypothetical protein PBRA_004764 [Plasmodiophora brassicae]
MTEYPRSFDHRLVNGVQCEVIDHDMSPGTTRTFLGVLSDALAFCNEKAPAPDLIAQRLENDGVLQPGWFVFRSKDREFSCDIADYDPGTYMRFCLAHDYIYVAFRLHRSGYSHDYNVRGAVADSDSEDQHGISYSDDEFLSTKPPPSSSYPPGYVAKRWTARDVEHLRLGVAEFGTNWTQILRKYDFRGRDAEALMERWGLIQYGPPKPSRKRRRRVKEDEEEGVVPSMSIEETQSQDLAAPGQLPVSSMDVSEDTGSVKSLKSGEPIGDQPGGGLPEEPEVGAQPSAQATAPRKRTSRKNRSGRVMRFYTPEEEQHLKDGVEEFGTNWKQIQLKYWGENPERSTKSLAKKWRIMMELSKEEDELGPSDADNVDDGEEDEEGAAGLGSGGSKAEEDQSPEGPIQPDNGRTMSLRPKRPRRYSD